MSDSKSETVDHWSFVDGVKSPLCRLADACLDAYEENGNPLLEEAANALRAIETVKLESIEHTTDIPPSLPWRVSKTVLSNGLNHYWIEDANHNEVEPATLEEPVCHAIVECMNTVHALQTKNGGK